MGQATRNIQNALLFFFFKKGKKSKDNIGDTLNTHKQQYQLEVNNCKHTYFWSKLSSITHLSTHEAAKHFEHCVHGLPTLLMLFVILKKTQHARHKHRK